MPIHNPLHPGAIIHEILIVGASICVTEAAEKLDVNRTTLSRLLHGHIGISPEMALRLSQLLPNTDMTFWLNIQRDYDIWMAKKRNARIHIRPLELAKAA